MKTKTIKKVISKKMVEWLETITDIELRKKVKDNLLVSGGSIASMLLKEPINDFDVYIQDMDVLVELAEYYCKDKVLDGRKRKEYLNRNLEERGFKVDIEKYHDYDKDMSELFIRYKNLKENQVKLDVSGVGILLAEEEKLKEEDKYIPVFLSQNAISLSHKVQIVLRFNGTPEQVHKTFDFIHATNYFTFKEGLVLNKKALESLITKNLSYQGSLYPITSVIRMKKFIGRGWTINAGEILKILFQVSELKLTDVDILEEQLIGVDVAYFAILIDAIRGIKSEQKLTSAYISSLIDKIFNEYEEE